MYFVLSHSFHWRATNSKNTTQVAFTMHAMKIRNAIARPVQKTIIVWSLRIVRHANDPIHEWLPRITASLKLKCLVIRKNASFCVVRVLPPIDLAVVSIFCAYRFTFFYSHHKFHVSPDSTTKINIRRRQWNGDDDKRFHTPETFTVSIPLSVIVARRDQTQKERKQKAEKNESPIEPAIWLMTDDKQIAGAYTRSVTRWQCLEWSMHWFSVER